MLIGVAFFDLLNQIYIFLSSCDIHGKPDSNRGSLEAETFRSMAPGVYEATIGTPGHLQHTYVYDACIRPRVLRCYRCIS